MVLQPLFQYIGQRRRKSRQPDDLPCVMPSEILSATAGGSSRFDQDQAFRTARRDTHPGILASGKACRLRQASAPYVQSCRFR